MEKIEKPNIKILVCCHKPGEWISDDIYTYSVWKSS